MASRQDHRAAADPLRQGEQGFSLIESLVSLLLVSLLLSGLVLMFQEISRTAQLQIDLAGLQQALRIGQHEVLRHLRMAGRGGLPLGNLPEGTAIGIRNAVPEEGDEARVARADHDSPEAVAGTDVLIVRGVLTGPIFQIEPGTVSLLGAPPTAGSLQVRDPSPSGVSQALEPLRKAIGDRTPEALLLVTDSGSGYSVVELDPNTSSLTSRGATLGFRIEGGTHTSAYRRLGPDPALPGTLESIHAVGLLEEYRFYVRKKYQVPGDPESGLAPRLAKARLFPGTETAHAGRPSNLRLDIADGISDLQAAMGLDRDGDFVANEDVPPSTTDEWLFNAAGDGQAAGSGGTVVQAARPRPLTLRVTTLGRLARPDSRYLAAPLHWLEDREYGETTPPSGATERVARSHRRRIIRSTIGLRNLW